MLQFFMHFLETKDLNSGLLFEITLANTDFPWEL